MIEIVNEVVDVETSDINYGTVGHRDSVMFCDSIPRSGLRVISE